MSAKDPGERSGPLWRWWTGETGPFYHACAVWPFDDIGGESDDVPGPDRPGLQFVHGPLRTFLRHMPVILLVAMTVSFWAEQVGDYYSPLGTYLPFGSLLPAFQPVYLAAVPLGLLWVVGLAKLFADAGTSREPRFHRTAVFYATTAVLALGVAFSVYLVWTGQLTDPRQHLTFRAGYFLFLLLEVHLVYDGLVLRGENLFWKLHENGLARADRYTGPEGFRQRLADALRDPLEIGPVTVSRATVFAFILLVPIAPLPVLTIPAGNPAQYLSYGFTVLLQFVLVATLFQFGVLLRHFGELLSGDYLEYDPFHPDEHGGFRDLGEFATRINVMLVVAGGYVTFRFYTGGLRVLQGTGLETVLDGLRWLTSFVGPIVVYVFVVLMWLYFSFYRMHREMKRGRQRILDERQRAARESGHSGDSLDTDATTFEALQTAPTWPIDRSSLAGIVVLDTVPILASTLL